MTTRIELPLTERQAQAVAAAAFLFNVASWEIAVNALEVKRRVQFGAR